MTPYTNPGPPDTPNYLYGCLAKLQFRYTLYMKLPFRDIYIANVKQH